MTPRIQANDLKAFGRSFPARELTTKLNWQDVGAFKKIKVELAELRKEEQSLRRAGKAKSYRVLFSGPPGTGKTLAALLLGQKNGRRVVYVDLPNLISRYIGETEKNLSKLLERAEAENWLLFFDEADALFGKRTEVKDSHDRYANQEVSYLLQRMEQHADLVIFSTNARPERNEALRRYFHRIIRFTGDED